MKAYIGVDPGIAFTGVAAITEDRRVIETRTIKTYPRWSLQHRLITIERGVREVVQEVIDRGFEPDSCMVEGFAFWGGKRGGVSQFVRAAVVTGGATAAALLASAGVEGDTVTPAQWRKSIGVSMGGASTRDDRKRNVRVAVERELGKQPVNQSDHETDALGLALYGLVTDLG